MTQIGGEINELLLCLTTNTECCRPGAGDREWWLPDGRYVSPQDVNQALRHGYGRSRGPSVVRLHRNRLASTDHQTGVFTCTIPDSNNITQQLYIGIFSSHYIGNNYHVYNMYNISSIYTMQSNRSSTTKHHIYCNKCRGYFIYTHLHFIIH